MRVTNNAFSGAFLNSYNSLLSNYLKSQTKILTQRKYNRASEDSPSAAKAAHVRKSLENLDIYDENLKTAKDFFYAAEDALYDIADKTYLNIKAKIVSVQDTMDQTELDAIALELEQQAEHIVQDMNTDFATRQMFGSASNDKTPFTVYSRVEITMPDGTTKNFGSEFDADGNVISDNVTSDDMIYYSEPDKNSELPAKIVCYNDVPVNLMGEDLKNAVNGSTIKYYDDKGKLVAEKTIKCPSESGGADGFPGTTPIYVDIGLGVKYDENGVINPATALDMSLNGAQITGCGTDKDNDSLNLIQLVYDAAAALRKGDITSVNRYIDKLDEANSKVLDAITTLGVKQNNMQMYIDRNDVYRISLSEKQNTLEGVDIEEEITNMKSIEAAYNASLSLGSGIIPKSIFDFV
ncbi:MAG: flagellin [Huintestinicola sp.]|uniref:flagellin n=1 Tax=Huintestinicola sp. TaxID=2981661 RepID=UPI003F028D54